MAPCTAGRRFFGLPRLGEAGGTAQGSPRSAGCPLDVSSAIELAVVAAAAAAAFAPLRPVHLAVVVLDSESTLRSGLLTLLIGHQLAGTACRQGCTYVWVP